MSDPTIVQCVLAFNNTGESAVESVRLLVALDTTDEAAGFFAALKAREPFTVSARNLRFYDRAFKIDGRDAAQYRPVTAFGVAEPKYTVEHARNNEFNVMRGATVIEAKCYNRESAELIAAALNAAKSKP